jgi:hypothetical protein
MYYQLYEEVSIDGRPMYLFLRGSFSEIELSLLATVLKPAMTRTGINRLRDQLLIKNASLSPSIYIIELGSLTP